MKKRFAGNVYDLKQGFLLQYGIYHKCKSIRLIIMKVLTILICNLKIIWGIIVALLTEFFN